MTQKVELIRNIIVINGKEILRYYSCCMYIILSNSGHIVKLFDVFFSAMQMSIGTISIPHLLLNSETSLRK